VVAPYFHRPSALDRELGTFARQRRRYLRRVHPPIIIIPLPLPPSSWKAQASARRVSPPATTMVTAEPRCAGGLDMAANTRASQAGAVEPGAVFGPECRAAGIDSSESLPRAGIALLSAGRTVRQQSKYRKKKKKGNESPPTCVGIHRSKGSHADAR
jgi:hypothetical protein